MLKVFRACHQNIDLLFFSVIRPELELSCNYWERKDFSLVQVMGLSKLKAQESCLEINKTLANTATHPKISFPYSNKKIVLRYNGDRLPFIMAISSVKCVDKLKICMGPV